MSESFTATLPTPASATARAWLDRLHALQELRAQFADAPDFQRWVIQARVLRFLLNAHASDPWLDDHPSPSQIAEPYINLFAGAGKPPRSAEDIRPVLNAIAEQNRDIKLRLEAQTQRNAQQRMGDSTTPPIVWPELPPESIGLCIAGSLGDNTAEYVASILDDHLGCGRDQALAYASQLHSGTRLLIAGDRTKILRLAADLRAIGLKAIPSR